MQSPNFEAYSSAGERETRDALRYFERVRGFFLQIGQGKPAKSAPAYIVIFGSEKEYAPYRFNEASVAYYYGTPDRDYIVMGRTGEQAAQTAVHEYVHLLSRHEGLKVPVWLSEGIAELYSTLRMQVNKTLVGDLIPGRLQVLFNEKWIPLPVILSADQRSPYYNEKNKAGSFYSESWALVHMLSLSRNYRPKYHEFLVAVQGGATSAAALEKIYGKTVAQVEDDLQSYFRGNQFFGRLFDVKLADAFEKTAGTPAPMFDVKIALADLADRPGKEAEVRKTLEDLASENPGRPEPWTRLGYMAWRHDQRSEAAAAFAKAYERGDHSPKLLWDWGRLAERPEDMLEAFGALLQQEPDRVDVRMELASLHLNSRRPIQALAVLGDVSRVTAEEAPRFFTLLASAQIQTGDRAAARISVAKLAANAKTPADRTRVNLMQDYLQQADAPPPVLAERATEGSTRLVRPPVSAVNPPVVPPLPPTPEAEGTFAEFVCLEKGFKIVVDTAAGRKVFLLPKADDVVVVGPAGGKVDLECGRQKPVHVKVQYAPRKAGEEGDGTIQVLSFEP